MASTQSLTSALLQERTGETLQQFIKAQVELGNDTTGIQAALLIATGEMYDRRTVKALIVRYSK